jgi:hypothetical protein
MIDVVSQELFKDFTRCLAASLERAAEEPPTAGSGHAEAEHGAAGEARAEGQGASAGAAASEPDALDGFSLLLRALRAWLRRLFDG